MKTILTILLLTFNLYAQEVITVLRGSGIPTPPPDLTIDYMVTAESDTMFTSEGDTMKLAFIQFDILEQIKNGDNGEEDIILPQRTYAVLNSKRTMDFTV